MQHNVIGKHASNSGHMHFEGYAMPLLHAGICCPHASNYAHCVFQVQQPESNSSNETTTITLAILVIKAVLAAAIAIAFAAAAELI